MFDAAESGVIDSVQLAQSAPILVQLAERQWGASATLPLSILPGALACSTSTHGIADSHCLSGCSYAGSCSSGRIGVIRDAFTPFNAREYPLHTTIASLGENKAAVHSAAAFNPQGIVVDEYKKDSANGVFRLTNVATDLLR